MKSLPEEALPALHRDADAASLAAQRQFFAATSGSLLALFFAAVFGAVDASWAGYGAAIAFVAALSGSYVLLKVNPERAWYDGRAVAESTKTLAWQYAVGGGDFPRAGDAPGSDAERVVDERFVAALAEVRRGLGDVAPVPQGSIEQLTQPMRDLRAAPLDARRATYLEERVDDQCKWYSKKSGDAASKRVRWGSASAGLQAIGLLGALGKAAEIVHFDLLGIAAAAALGSVGWLRAKDYAELSRAYAIAASELGDAKVPLRNSRDETEWAVSVRDAESAISREHTRWAARRHHRRAGPAT